MGKLSEIKEILLETEVILGYGPRYIVVANVAQVYTYYEIGRQIVEEEQGGKRRADYGKQIIEDLSLPLRRGLAVVGERVISNICGSFT